MTRSSQAQSLIYLIRLLTHSYSGHTYLHKENLLSSIIGLKSAGEKFGVVLFLCVKSANY